VPHWSCINTSLYSLASCFLSLTLISGFTKNKSGSVDGLRFLPRLSIIFSKSLTAVCDGLCFCLRLFLRGLSKTVSILCHGVRFLRLFIILSKSLPHCDMCGAFCPVLLHHLRQKRSWMKPWCAIFLRLSIILSKTSWAHLDGVCSLLCLLMTQPSIQNTRNPKACAGDCPVFSKKTTITTTCLHFRNHQEHITMDAMTVGRVEKL